MTDEELFYKGGIKTIMEAIYDYIYDFDEQTESEVEEWYITKKNLMKILKNSM